jgi:hypothetical protein
MKTSLADVEGDSQATSVDRTKAGRSTEVDHALATLRDIVDEQGHTIDSLAAHMTLDRSYVYRVLHGEKTLTLPFLSALPPGVEVEFHARRAEQAGRIVVSPLDFEMARRSLVAGLMGVLAARLPERAGPAAKAGLK